jgi:hypothetical protein
VKVTLASWRRIWPLAVNSIRFERPSVGFGSRLHHPLASILPTSLLVPPTVMNNASAMCRTRQSGVALIYLHGLQPRQRQTVLLADSGVHPVPQVGLQADHVTKQTDKIDLHGFTLAHVNSVECKSQQVADA